MIEKSQKRTNKKLKVPTPFAPIDRGPNKREGKTFYTEESRKKEESIYTDAQSRLILWPKVSHLTSGQEERTIGMGKREN